jgi:hypothetical protein
MKINTTMEILCRSLRIFYDDFSIFSLVRPPTHTATLGSMSKL